MKTEINQENKEKFFCQYWGQKVLTDSVEIHKIGHSWNLKHPDFFLQLKPLSQISDEDAIKVAKIIMISTYEKQSPNFKEVILKFLQSFDKYRFSFEITLRVADYMRSKGYALPWMGLSVDEMVQAGWIKLTEQ